jgi:hypothetical protein
MKRNLKGFTKNKIRKLKRARIIRLMQAATNPSLIFENDPDFVQCQAMSKSDSEGNKIYRLVQKQRNHVPNKIAEVAKLADKLSREKKNVVIFTHFRGNVKLLVKILTKKTGQIPLWLTGEPRVVKYQEEIIEDFKNWNLKDGRGRILVATAGMLAESVSLHKNKNDQPVCNNAIFLERSYDAGKYMQALHRIYRIGSLKKFPVNYYVFISKFRDGDDQLRHKLCHICKSRHLHIDKLKDGSKTLDSVINDRLKIRLKRLYKLLSDEFNLHVVSLDTGKVKKGNQKGKQHFHGESDNGNEVEEELYEMEKKNKKSMS